VPASQITGWLVPPGDPDALAQRLCDVLRLTPEARSAMAARAQADIAGRFTLAAMKSGTLAVYDRLLGTDLARRSRLPERSEPSPMPLD
jgi:glycosyltransferase involved in cell wall biosynthesis